MSLYIHPSLAVPSIGMIAIHTLEFVWLVYFIGVAGGDHHSRY
jgi:hypothetical protein